MQDYDAHIAARFEDIMDVMLSDCTVRERQRLDRIDRRLEPCLKNTIGFLGRKYAGHLAVVGIFSIGAGAVAVGIRSEIENLRDDRLRHSLLVSSQSAGFRPHFASLNEQNDSLDFYQQYAACELTVSESPHVGFIVSRPDSTAQIVVVQNYDQLAALALTANCLPASRPSPPASTPNRH